MDSEDNKEFEIIMGGDADFDISEVGDSINVLKPNTSEKKQNIIIPISKKKEQNSDDEDDNNEDEIEISVESQSETENNSEQE